MGLSKAERAALKQKYDGRCAYCGDLLGDRWHADHLEPVIREQRWESGRGFVATGTVLRPHNEAHENYMPSCAPCNIDKGSNSLEWWRGKLQRAPEVLSRNSPTYRHAKRFGLVQETVGRVAFYFERITPKTDRVNAPLVAE